MKRSEKHEIVNMDTYPRREHYNHYLNMRCTYSVTVNIDITKLRANLKCLDLRVMPSLTWLLANAVNGLPEFRMGKDENENLIIWDVLHPCYVVMNDKTKTFSGLWTEYSVTFMDFYNACVSDIEKYADGSLEPKGKPPQNQFFVSSVPFLPFTSLSFNVADQWFTPILTVGQFAETEGKTVMPFAIQVHHAVCDGYHVGQFVQRVQDLADHCEMWL
ncbi:MAG: chloramphenicol acetyltransferase [Oscillospiraceae bacterium]|nr:chloramphenicol acetyltransferase [Oscillospiraceae bacterium]